MNSDPQIFNRTFSLRQAFKTTNFIFVVLATFFALLTLGIVLKVKRDEITLKLDEQVNHASIQVESILSDAEVSVQNLADSISFFSAPFRGDKKTIESWFNQQGHALLTTHDTHFSIYFALSKNLAQKLVKQDGYFFQLTKNPDLIDTPEYNDPTGFIRSSHHNSSYQGNAHDAWYLNAAFNRGVQFIPQSASISLTAGGRNFQTGELLGVAGLELSTKALAKMIGQITLGKTGGTFLTDDQGNLIIPSLAPVHPLLGPYMKRGKMNVEGHNGKNYLLQSRKIKNRPYYLVGYIEENEAYSSLYLTLGILIGFATLFLCLSFILRQKLADFVVGNIDGILRNISGNRNLFEEPHPGARFQRLSPNGPREIAKIAFQLNLLYARLQASFKEIASERDRAEAATRAKSRFLSVMSHEIRTPLNSMLGLTDVLLKSPLNPAQIEYLSVLQNSGDSLLRILNDILDHSRLEAGKLKIDSHPFNLSALLSDIESLTRVDAETKGVRFDIVAPSSDYRLEGDSLRIRQALLNLVGNAIKFTKEGSVEVRVNAIDPPSGVFEFIVTDTGIGIDPEHQERLFSEFNQGDTSITRAYGGTGLGLSITRDIIELLGGKILIDSTVGKGTTFRFTIPLSILPESPNRSVYEPEDSIPADTTHESEKQKSILIVDDDEDNHRLMSAYIGFRNDCRATHAHSAQEAFEQIKSSEFSLIIMDMQMPLIDGLEATRIIRTLQGQGEAPKTPIVILSANTFHEDQEKSLAAGADAHIGKPIKLVDFNRLLKCWIPGIS